MPPSPLAGEGKGEGAHRSRQERLLAFAKTMRKEPTDAERRLWRMLRGQRLEGFKFKRQQPIGPFIADFVCFAKRLIVEADGGQHNGSVHDAQRDAWLSSQGFKVLRFWNHEILHEQDMVEMTILRASGSALFQQGGGAPSPLPSPARGEGGFGGAPYPEASMPGGLGAGGSAKQGSSVRLTAPTPMPPSPLAGEGEGEGARRSRQAGVGTRAKPRCLKGPTP